MIEKTFGNFWFSERKKILGMRPTIINIGMYQDELQLPARRSQAVKNRLENQHC